MATMEFPDTHHKMSKKIAQLTKVVYHLNTRNDDNEAMMRSLIDQFEAEIGEVTNDAKTKMSALAKISEEKSKEVMIVKGALQTLTMQKDTEAAEANRRFEAFKLQVARNEDNLVKAAEEKVAAMTREVSSLKEAFHEQVKNSAQNANQTDAKWREQLAEMRTRKDQEMEGLVKEYNERYKAMMAKMMQEREADKAQLEAEWSKKSMVWEDKFRSEKKRGDEAESKVKALTEMRAEDSKRIQDLTAEMRLMNEELSRLRGKEATLNESVATTLRQLTAAEELAKSLSGKSSQLGSELDTAEQQRQSLMRQLESLRRQQEEEHRRKAEELENLRKQQEEDQRRRARELEALAASSAAEREALLKKQQMAQSEADERMRQLNQGQRSLSDNVALLQDQCNKLQAQLNAEQSNVAALKSALKEMETSHKVKINEATKEFEGRIERITVDYEARLKAAQEGATVSGQELTQQWEERLRKREAEITSTFQTEKRNLQESHTRQLADIAETHRKAIEKAIAEFEALQKKLNETVVQLAASEAKGKSDLEAMASRLREKEAEFEKAMASTSSGAEERIKKLREDLDTEKKAHGLSRQESASARAALELQHKGAIAALNADLESANTKLKALEAEVGRLKVQLGDTTEIKAAEERVRQELQRKLETALATHATEKKRLEEDISKMKSSNAEDMKRLREEMEGKLAKSSLGADEAQAALRRQLEEEHARQMKCVAEAAAKDKAEEVARHVELLQQEKRRWAAHEQDLRDRIARLEGDSAAKSADADRLMRERDALSQADIQALKDKITAMERDAAQRLQEALAEGEKKLKALREEHEASMAQAHGHFSNALKAAEEKALLKLNDAVAKHEQSRIEDARKAAENKAMALAELIAENKLETDGLRQEIAKGKVEWENVRAQLLSMTKEMEKWKLTESTLRGEMDRQKIEAENRLQEYLRRLAAEKESALAQAKNEHSIFVQSKNTEIDALKLSLTQSMQRSAELEELLAQVEYKYANRESRAEDVAKINELLREIKEKEEALIRTHQDMLRYKLELVNKEESYNKLFGKHPKVAGGHMAEGTARAMPQQPVGAPATNSFAGPVGAGTNVALTNGRRVAGRSNSLGDDLHGEQPGGVPRVEHTKPISSTRTNVKKY